MPPREHIIISGTGRTGTTLLVEILTSLGLDTGFSADDLQLKKSTIARAGLEFDIRDPDCPYIVKSPHFCDHAAEILHDERIRINHVLIPIRDLQAAADSRRHVTRAHMAELSILGRIRHFFFPRHFNGGTWHTDSLSQGEQEVALLNQVYKLLLALAGADIKVTLLNYPRLARDPDYLFDKLKPIFPELERDGFVATFQKTVDPALIHDYRGNELV